MIRRSPTNPLRRLFSQTASTSSRNTQKGLWRKTKPSSPFSLFIIIVLSFLIIPVLLSILFTFRHRETVLDLDAKNRIMKQGFLQQRQKRRDTKPFAESTELQQPLLLLPPKLQPQLHNQTTTLYQKHVNLHPNKTFPYPAPPSSQIILQPLRGAHHPHRNAIFGLAEGYNLGVFVLFLTSLRQTGYDGDVVLAGTGTQTVKGGFTDCKIRNFFGDSNGNPMDDPVIPRPVATARFELYWAWSLRYDPHVQILLIDVRDVYFQLNPFDGLKSSEGGESGILRLFEENRNAISIQTSEYNRQWIRTAYGKQSLDTIANKPVLCSGATIGEQIAIEPYLRAMIHQFRVTKCKRKGCDQGFHNYLFYYDQLRDLKGISEVWVYPQGGGVVNNLAAMRGRPLREQEVLKGDGVVNWDGRLSPVVHQFDRDEELKKIMEGRRRSMMAKLNS